MKSLIIAVICLSFSIAYATPPLSMNEQRFFELKSLSSNPGVINTLSDTQTVDSITHLKTVAEVTTYVLRTSDGKLIEVDVSFDYIVSPSNPLIPLPVAKVLAIRVLN